MDMKDKEPKTHPLVKVSSALSALALAVSQVGCKALGVESLPPEGTQARSTEVVPPPSSTLEATAPVSIQPMVQETLVAGATSTPESVSPVVWAPPTLEQMAVEGRGGTLDPEIAKYKFEEVIPNDLARIGIEGTVVNFSNNGLSGNNYRWAPLTINPEGLVIWAYDPAMGQLEWPVKLDPLLDAAGNTYYRLHTEGLLYQPVPDSEGAQIVWGGTKDGISGKYLAVLGNDLITLPDGRQIYSVYWSRTSQSWLSTPGLATAMESEYRETLTPEQLKIYDTAPQVEGFKKFMLPSGPLSETVFYTNDKFIRVWDEDPANAENKEVRPALLIENEKRVVGLIIDWRSEIDKRVTDEEAMRRLGSVFEYQMKRFCGRSNNIPDTSSIEDIKDNEQLNSLLEAGCTITLQKERDYLIRRQDILVSNHSILRMRWVRDEEHIPQEVRPYLARDVYAINTDRYHVEGVAMVQGEGNTIEIYNSRSGPFNDDNPYIWALFDTFIVLDSRVSGKLSAIGRDWSLFTTLFRLEEGNMYARDLITTK